MDGSADLSGLTAPSHAALSDARLAEFNHRVLNSLTMISSIIGMESRAVADPAGRAALDRVRSRLVAVSNLYRILGTSDSATSVDAGRYLKDVAEAVASSVGCGENVVVEVKAAQCGLSSSQAASIGLIANEAMTNAYKHAFGGAASGRIRVELSEARGVLMLSVSDDGGGMADAARDGLGTTLIEALAMDLAGEVSVTSDGTGTCVRVRFPRFD